MTERLPIVIGATGEFEEIQAGDNIPAEDLSTTLAAGNTTGGSNLVISSGDIITSPASTGMIAQAGGGVGAGGGGSATFASGAGGPTGSGGAAALISGSGGTTSGDGGLVQIMAGAGTGAANIGGTVSATGGSGGAVAAGGPITLSGGSTTAASQMAGPATLQSGTSSNGSPADVTVRARAGGSGFDGADVIIEASTPPAGNADGGDVTISAGAGSGTGVDGHVIVSSTLNAELDLLFDEAGVPSTLASQGAVFVGDGTGGTTANGLYYRAESDGALTRLDVVGGGESLAATLAIGNTTGGANIVVSVGDKITSPPDASLTIDAGDGTLALPGGVLLATAGDGGPSGASGGIAALSGGAATGGSSAGGALLANGGSGGALGDGGSANLTSGAATASGKSSGDTNIKSGNSTAGPAGAILVAVGIGGPSVDGSDVTIAAGQPPSGNGDGGSIILVPQPGVGTGVAGSVRGDDGNPLTIETRPSVGDGSMATLALQGASSTIGAAGAQVDVTAGDGGTTSSAGGDVKVQGGAGGTTDGGGGNVRLVGGTGTGAGDDGQVRSETQHRMSQDIQLLEIAPPSTPASVGSVFVGDGSGGTVLNGLYYRAASDGALTRLDVVGGAAALSAVLGVGNTTGASDIEIDAAQKITLGETAPPAGVANKGHVYTADGTSGTAVNGLYYTREDGTQIRLDNTSGTDRVEYMDAGWSGDQNIADASVADVLFDVDQVNEANGITLAANIISLKAGKTYKLEANVRLFNITGLEILFFQWYDRTASTLIGNCARVRGLTTTADTSNQQTASLIFTPSVDTDVDVRTVAGGNGNVDIQASSSFVQVTQIAGLNVEGSGEFMFARLSTNQIGLDPNDLIAYDTVDGNAGITLSANQFSLKAGKRYLLCGEGRITNALSAGTFVRLAWYDETNGAEIPGARADIRPMNATNTTSSDSVAKAYVQPATDISVSLRVLATNAANDADMSSGGTSATLLEIGGGAAALSTVLGVGNTTGGTDIEITAGDVVLAGESAPPTTAANQGAVFVGDGTGGTTANGLYYRAESSGALTRLDADSGGGGGSILAAVLSADQVTPGDGTRIAFNTNQFQVGSDIALDTVTNIGRFTLQPGNYELEAMISLNDSASAGMGLRWVEDPAGAATHLVNRAIINSHTSASNRSNAPMAKSWVSPTVATEYELQVDGVPTNSPDIVAQPTYAVIRTVGGGGRGDDSIFASMSTNQLNLVVDDPIEFDTAEASRGLSVDSAGKFSGLVAGKTYVMDGTARMEFTASGQSMNLRWYNVTAGAYFGSFACIRPVVATGANFSSQDQARAVLAPSVNTEVELRAETVSASGVIDVTAACASAYIREF
jgi:hypothetical protein